MKALKAIALLVMPFIVQNAMAQENAKQKRGYFNITELAITWEPKG